MTEENIILRNSFDIKNRTKYFLWVLLGLSMSSILIFTVLVKNLNNSTEDKEAATEKLDPFALEEIQAKGVFVYDILNQRELYSKNADVSMPLASLTKVMTALAAYDLLPENTKVQIIEDYLTPDGDSGFAGGDLWNLKNLIDYTLMTSSNDGAHALAAVAGAGAVRNADQNPFVIRMNELAENIGLSNSVFLNEHGLDINTEAGAYGSARDIAILFEYIMENNPHILEATRYNNLAIDSRSLIYKAENTNSVVDKIPGIIASKTGFTDIAGGNLAIVFDAGINRPVIVVVLGSSQEGRFDDTLKLVNASIQKIQNDN